MKSKHVVLLTSAVWFIIFGFLSYYNLREAAKIIHGMEERVDATIEQNQNTLDGALGSFNFIYAQMEEQIAAKETENVVLRTERTKLLALATQQEIDVQPILDQFPEVQELVNTQKQVIENQAAELANIKFQLANTQEQLAAAKCTIDTLVVENGKLVAALEDFKGDLSKLLKIQTKKPSTIETVAKWSGRALLVVAALK